MPQCGRRLEAIVALVFDSASRSARAGLNMVQHGFVPCHPVAPALIIEAGADPEMVLRPP